MPKETKTEQPEKVKIGRLYFPADKVKHIKTDKKGYMHENTCQRPDRLNKKFTNETVSLSGGGKAMRKQKGPRVKENIETEMVK